MGGFFAGAALPLHGRNAQVGRSLRTEIGRTGV
jgi:hypothetical protein